MPFEPVILEPKKYRPFRTAVLRGLGVLIPPLLTVVILLWVLNTTRVYVLDPINTGVRDAIVWLHSGNIRENLPISNAAKRIAVVDGVPYQECADHRFVPLAVYEKVQHGIDNDAVPGTAKGVYQRYVEISYLKPQYSIPCFLAVFILIVYLLGKFITVGIGGFLVRRFEVAIQRLPLVRSVYKATKQVSDFFFTERQIQFSRVVAVEYPRPGMWSLAFVTSEGLSDIRAAANEPVLGVFIPSSPMPLSGYALVVLKREAIDLNLSIEEAIQYLVSCGLVMPQKDLQQLRRSGDHAVVEAAESALPH